MSEKDFRHSLIIVKTKVLWSLQMSQVACELLVSCLTVDPLMAQLHSLHNRAKINHSYV